MTRQRSPSKQTKRVLKTLYDAPNVWWHGYELCKQTGLKSGTVYPILMRLSDQGYLNSEWRMEDAAGKPPRHVYRLSSTGKSLAQSLEATEKVTADSFNGRKVVT